jgi:hypothetical protein
LLRQLKADLGEQIDKAAALKAELDTHITDHGCQS